MKFKIKRTTGLFQNYPPCDKAYKEGEDWYIEIKDLRELLDLAEKEVGDSEIDTTGIIVSWDEGEFKLEIYDGYRE
jgi:hypothetical protein